MTSLDDIAAALAALRERPPFAVRLRMSSDVYGLLRHRHLADPMDVLTRPVFAAAAVPVRVDPTLPAGTIRAEMSDGSVRDLSTDAVDPQASDLVPPG